mgnify:CR=1 FL=1|jgi:hypothetical protein|tara:strand:+ start:140 stop:433 length:294 start_codon:yes stop_codon:yes gene_type:complete
MPFQKTFPKQIPGSNYPQWEEISLSDEEDKVEDEKARKENIALMKECIDDARALLAEKGLKAYETSIISTASSLFEKRASHSVYFKERKAKEKFDNK